MTLTASATLPIQRVHDAAARIRPYIRHTPMMPLPHLSPDVPAGLRLKLENLQVTGAFKVRGVFNTLLQLDESQRRNGVITASGGNHGVAQAYACSRLGVPSIVYLPETATADRVGRIESWGSTVYRHGRNWDDAHIAAMAHSEREGLVYIHSFDADWTIEGQATVALEILEDTPEIDCALIAIGGGGLIAGCAAVFKAINPNIEIIGVEPTGAASMRAAVDAGIVVELPGTQTIADTLSPRAVGAKTLALTREHVDRIVTVEDMNIVHGMRWLWRHANQLVEPSGAAVIAAMLTGVVDLSASRCAVAIICGGNAGAEPVFAAYEAMIAPSR